MKKFLIYTLYASLIFAFVSCDKWLELKPQDGIVGDKFWNTKEQVDAAVTGVYTSMQGNTEFYFIWGESRADMVSPGFRASQYELDLVNINILPDNNFVNWRNFYQTINYCNTILQLAPGVLEEDNTFTETHLNRALGEALALRSLMYFYLVRSFRDVPLKLDATLSDGDIKNLPKSTAGVILDQIVADLKKAELYLPITYGNIDRDKGRITRYAVNAMLADVYLWMDKYTECTAECDKIINAGNFQILPGQQFYDLFLRGNTAESIFELQFDIQRLNPFWGMHVPQNRRWGASPNLPDLVYGIDLINPTPIEDFRGKDAAYRGADFSIWKYVGADNGGDNFRNADQSYAHWIFYRYADILLLKAEAINQLNQPLEASRIVKQLRNRANAIDFKAMDSTSKESMTLYILEERQRELAFEGKRWFDALRNAKRNNYERLQILLDIASRSLPADRVQAALSKLRDQNSHYFPIYFYELQTNNLLEQNPFYK